MHNSTAVHTWLVSINPPHAAAATAAVHSDCIYNVAQKINIPINDGAGLCRTNRSVACETKENIDSQR